MGNNLVTDAGIFVVTFGIMLGVVWVANHWDHIKPSTWIADDPDTEGYYEAHPDVRQRPPLNGNNVDAYGVAAPKRQPLRPHVVTTMTTYRLNYPNYCPTCLNEKWQREKFIPHTYPKGVPHLCDDHAVAWLSRFQPRDVKAAQYRKVSR